MKDKIKNYFKDKKINKKEGLYIAVFTGVCVLLISGVVVLKNLNANNSGAEKPNEKEIALEIPKDKEVNNVMENSERVNKDKAEKPVTSTPKLSFANPVEGKIVKGNNDAIISENGTRSDMFGGISIAVKLGTDVKAAEVGIIEDIKNNDITFGTTVTIKHPNGLKTEYCNLDANLKIKKGDKVTKGQVIGKVGKTAQSLSAALKCDFMHLKMYQSKDKGYEQIDPSVYFSFKK